MTYRKVSSVLQPRQVELLEVRPQEAGATFYTTFIRTTEHGSVFEFRDILVGRESQIGGTMPASTYSRGYRGEGGRGGVFAGCVFPLSIFFWICNVGARPGQLVIDVGGDHLEPEMGVGEVFTIT
jgi:hypothetical protein